MSKFHPLKIKRLRKETADCISISFEVPQELEHEFHFTQGQHLTLRTFMDGEDVRRSYSICASPSEKELKVAVKKVADGRFSTFALETLAKGDTLDVMPPMGHFYVKLDPSQKKHYVAFVAGSGITPVISILKTTLETEPQSHFTLFYGNKNAESVIFREEIEGLKNRYMTRLSLHHILSREDQGTELFFGRIDEEKCTAIFDKVLAVNDIDEFFICGPESMIDGVRKSLSSLGVAEKKVHFELFTSPVGKLGTAQKWVPPSKPIHSSIQITVDAKTFQFDLDAAGLPILDAAQKAGADLPYACKGGVCCTCKAKVLEGEVEMEVNYGLEPEEVEAGYVLTCQSHPKSSKVVLSFDE